MKKLLLLIVAVMFAAVTLPACSDDDEGNDNPPTQTDDYASLIVGKWETIHYYSENNEGEGSGFDVDQSMMAWHVVTFKADKTFSSGDAYNPGESTGLYSIEGNTLTTRFPGEIDVFKQTIKSLTATTLVLEYADSYIREVYTYKRI